MNVLKYRVSLDMFDTHSQTTIKAKKGDSACQIYITLAKKGRLYDIGEGCSATFNARKSDGNFIYDNCTIENNTIVYDFTSSVDENGVCQVSACEGIVECEVTLYSADGKQLTSPRFTLFVDETVYNGEEIASTPQSDFFKEIVAETVRTKQDFFALVSQGETLFKKILTLINHTTFDASSGLAINSENGKISLDGKKIELSSAELMELYANVDLFGSITFPYGNGLINNLATPNGKDPTQAVNVKYLTNQLTSTTEYLLQRIASNTPTTPTIENTVKGRAIKLTDISSSGEVIVGKVHSRNILPYPYVAGDSRTHNGITFTVLNDGSVHVQGTSTGYAQFSLCNNKSVLKHGVKYVSKTEYLNVSYIKGVYDGSDSNNKIGYWGANAKPLVLEQSCELLNVYLQISPNTTVDKVVYPMIEAADYVSTHYAPYRDVANLTVECCGKNLLNWTGHLTQENASWNESGVTAKRNKDGSITLTGTNTSTSPLYLFVGKAVLNTGNYYFYGGSKLSNNATALMYAYYKAAPNTTNPTFYNDVGNGIQLPISYDNVEVGVNMTIQPNATFYDYTVYPQIELGTSATEYESYVSSAELAVTDSTGNFEVPNTFALNTTLIPRGAGLELEVTYQADIAHYFNNKFNEIASAIVNS